MGMGMGGWVEFGRERGERTGDGCRRSGGSGSGDTKAHALRPMLALASELA